MALTKMYAFLLLIYLGGTVLPCVKSFSDGNLDGIQDICVNMNVEHDAPASSAAQSTFTVNPDNITITDANLATPIPVSLQTAGTDTFRGFMLEARTAADSGPVGVFTLVDSTKSRLQSCSGFSGNAVTQINNQDKSAVDVLWTAPAVGQYFFRATFVVNSEVTWLKQPVVILTTTTPTTTTTTTTTASTKGTTATATTTTTTPATPQPVTTVATVASASTQQSDSATVTQVTSLGPTNVTAFANGSTQQSDTTTVTPVTSLGPTNVTAFANGSTQQSDTTTVTPVTTLGPTNVTAFANGSTQQSDTTTVTPVTSLGPTNVTAFANVSTQQSGLTTVTQDTSLGPTKVTIVASTSTCPQGPSCKPSDTALPTQSPVMKKCRIWFLVLLLPSYLCLVECLSLLLKHRRQQNVILMKVLSVVSLVFSIAAFIVVLILTDLVAAKILIGVIVALGLCHTILIFLFVGPSHERRRHLCWAFGLIVFADLCLTTAAIFLGLVMLDVCVWVIIAMAVYVAFDVLFFIIFISCFASKKLRQNNQEVAHPVSYWCTCFVIFTVVNIAFTVAVIIGIFVCIGCP